jgi:hypothetical protein
VEIVVIDVDEQSVTDIDRGRGRRNVVNMSRKGAPTDTSGPERGVWGKYVAFGAVTPAHGQPR